MNEASDCWDTVAVGSWCSTMCTDRPAIARRQIMVKIQSRARQYLDLVKASGTARKILRIDMPWIPWS